MENYKFGDKLIVNHPLFNSEETDFFLADIWAPSTIQRVLVKRNGVEKIIMIENDCIKGIKHA